MNSPGEKRPRVQMKGAMWKKIALISISPAKPSDAGRNGGEVSGDDAEHHDDAVGDIEIGPVDREPDDGAGPIAPFEHEFLDHVDGVGGRRQPKPV